MKLFIVSIYFVALPLFAYENLSPAQVHARLAAGDSLQLLDVREVSEYQAGHIAEPTGMPIVIPANMPLNSGVLQENFDKLPRDIDIIVNCKSGGRSASASAFLESKGFMRIYNMTSGFNGWSYESRQGGFGDGSGAWIGTDTVTIRCSQEPSQAKLFFSKGAFPNGSRYVELHKVLAGAAPFTGLDNRVVLYQIIILDEFGLPIFKNTLCKGEDFASAAEIGLNLEQKSDLHYYSDQNVWITANDDVEGYIGILSSCIARWWLVVPQNANVVLAEHPTMNYSLIKTYPNPFNGNLKIDAPAGSLISIYDLQGRFITKLNGNIWQPSENIGSGLYFVRVDVQDKIEWNKVVYNK